MLIRYHNKGLWMILSEKYSSKYLNGGKVEILKRIDGNVKDIKNQMSSYCYKYVFELMAVGVFEFSKHYKEFKIDDLSAWETQTVFQDVSKFYLESIYKKTKNIKLITQEYFKRTYYKVNTKTHNKGEVKSFKVIMKKQSPMGGLVKYLSFCDIIDLNTLSEELKMLIDYY